MNLSKLEDNCNAIKFGWFCSLLEKISRTSGTNNKLRLFFSRELKAQLQGQSIYPLMRLLLPLVDNERGKYGLKQAMVAKTYVQALHLNKNTEDAQRLLNWKDPTKSQGVDLSKVIVGDFGLILEEILRVRVQMENSDATIGEVNSLLDEIAGAVSVEDKMTIVRNKILNRFNACEQKWLMRIIFQDLKIGLKHENVLGGYYPMAVKRYDECTNLRMVCEEETLNAALCGVQLFTHFSPMLAKGFPNATQGQLHAVESALLKQPFVMDLKLDGERTLIHIASDGRFTMFTRKGNDYTENYWPVAHDVIASVRKRSTGLSVIIDGEICAMEGSTKQLLSFGKNLTVAKLEREYGANKQDRLGWHVDLPNWLCFIAFDIVYIDGEGCEEHIQEALNACDLLGKYEYAPGEIAHLPLIVRRKLLDNLLEPVADRVQIVQHKYVLSEDIDFRRRELADYFDTIVTQGHEGLVVKSLTSPYVLGERSRRCAHWLKMKPEYGDSIEDIDVLILGGYYGEAQNFRGDGISTFLCGILDDVTGEYQTFAKVGTGYSFQELAKLREKLNPHAIPWDSKDQPPVHLQHWKIGKKDDRPDVYFLPENSVVLQLRCAEIVPSTAFSAGYTCRFPRVARIRYDKGYTEIVHLRELEELRHKPKMRIVRFKGATVLVDGNDCIPEEDEGCLSDEVGQKRKQTVSSSHPSKAKPKGPLVDELFTLEKIAKKKKEEEGKIFAGKTFCVLESDFTIPDSQRSFTRAELVENIRKQGGQIVASASYPNCQVIAGTKRTLQLKNLIQQGEKDILDFSFIVACLDAGYCLPEHVLDFVSVSKAKQQSFRSQYDIFGDSYTEEVRPEIFQKILKSIESVLLGRTAEADMARSYYECLKRMTWREIKVGELDFEEWLPLENVFTCLYQPSVVIYCDIYASLGPLRDESEEDSVMAVGYDPTLKMEEVNYMKALACRLRSRGAVVVNVLDQTVSHVILCAHKATAEGRSIVRDHLHQLRLKRGIGCEKRIVTSQWAERCIEEERLVTPTSEMIISLL